MQYFNVYERKGQDLIFVQDVFALSASQALTNWADDYGDNYGKVVILPVLRSTKSHSFEYPEN
jgi:hypothetical protein